jgi:hypothetical protein
LFLPFLLFTSCATITRGVHDKLYVQSEPSGAIAQLSTGERKVTPAKFVKSRRENFTVTVSKQGYTPQTVKVESKMSATGGTAMAGNVIAGGIIGIGIDAGTGAMLGLYPNPVVVHLVPVSSVKSSKKTSASSARKPPSKKTNRPASAKTNPPAKPSPTPEELPAIKSSPPPAPSPTATPYVPPVLESVPEKSPGP